MGTDQVLVINSATVLALGSALGGVIAFLFRLLLASKERELTECRAHIARLYAEIREIREGHARVLAEERAAAAKREADLVAATQRYERMLWEAVPVLNGLAEATRASVEKTRGTR